MSQAEHRSDETWAITDSHWRTIAEHIPHLAWMASPDGQAEFMNQQARDYLGWSPEGSLKEMWKAVIHPDDGPSAHRAWQHAVDTQTEYVAQFRLRHAGGEYFWHCGRALPIYGADGEVRHWIGTATDVDKHRRSEAALREIGDQLKEAQRLAKVGSWYTDVVTGTHQWSDEMYRLLGCEPGQFPPEPERFHERVHPADAGTMRAVAALQTTQPLAREVELRIVLPDIGLRWLAMRSEPVADASGEVVANQGTAQDVTERKLSEEHLRFQADLLDAVAEAVVATDLTGAIIYWGPGAEELYGWKAHEVLSRSIVDVIPAVPAPEPEAVAEIMARLSRGEPYTGNMVLGRRDGSTFVAQVTDTPVLDDAGRLVGIIGISSDVTAREEAHAQLERAHRSTGEALTLLATFQAEAPVGLGFVDRDFRYVRLNHELASIIGEPAEELVGRKVPDVVAPDLWGWLEPVLRRVLTTGEAVCNQPLIRGRGNPPRIAGQGHDGEVREWLISHYPVRVDDEIIGVGVIVQDVTDRARSEGFRSAVMSQVADGVYTQDCEGRLTYMNSAASKLLGWTESELRGKRMDDVVQHGSAGDSFIRKDGSTFAVAYSAVPLRVGSKVEGVAVVFRDVSEPGASPNVIRVILADGDRNATASFRALLDRHEGIDVVAVATTSGSAVESAERLKPDVVLVNVELPDLDGLRTTLAIKAKTPSTKVILMSEKHDDSIAIAGIEAGCAGVLDKSRAWVELVSAVRAAFHGETIISQEELQRVLSSVRREDAGRVMTLSHREDQVLACMREGCSNAQVAERLGISANTVRNHVQRILYKLNVHSKLEAVVLTSRSALQHGEP